MANTVSFIQVIRTILFYLLFSLGVICWGSICLIVVWFVPYRVLMKCFVMPWCRYSIGLAAYVVGIKYRVTGFEHIPSTPCVFVSKHQSAWETIFFTSRIFPLSNVLKRELLFIPFFGWVLALSRQVAINRSTPKEAFKQLIDKGCDLIKKGHYILIFPEGTRTLPGQNGRFTRGGVTLAASANVPFIPVAHNAGEFWPKRGWVMKAGTIDIVFGEPIMPLGTDPDKIAVSNKQAENWIIDQMQTISSCKFDSDKTDAK